MHLIGPQNVLLLRIDSTHNTNEEIAPVSHKLITAIISESGCVAEGLQLCFEVLDHLLREGNIALMQPVVRTLAFTELVRPLAFLSWGRLCRGRATGLP